MNRIFLAAAVALATACGGSDGPSIEYGPSQAPTYDEQLAAENAQATLAASSQLGDEPALGAPGLPDRVAADLGAYGMSSASYSGQASRLALRAPSAGPGSSLQAGMDPACVATTETSVTWTGCTVSTSETDPYTGDTTDMTVTMDGTWTWSPASGVTSWHVVQTVDLAMTADGQTLTTEATAVLDGDLAVSASAIVGEASSSVAATASYMGFSASEAVETTADVDLRYAADPFCITGGTLTVEQVWRRRPTGTTSADLPDQGWRFEWTGCDAFTVAHGT
jgi:hypothetical protein